MAAAIYSDIREKRGILREIYGGMMSLADLSRELGMSPEDAKVWASSQGIGTIIGRRIKYETDMVAKIIVVQRGMC